MVGAPDPTACRGGLVVALEANFCRVELEQAGPGGVERLLCTRRSRLLKTGQAICVGDRVRVEGIDWVAGRAAVATLLPRRNLLSRPAVANVERVVVVMALAEPPPEPLQLTRFLIAAEALGCAVELVFSKADLVPEAQRTAWCRRVGDWGYRALAISTRDGEGLPQLRARLREAAGISVLCGPSGVGKSSLLNALRPALDLRVGSVSGRLRRGRHTTRHVELFRLAAGALVADSPGFNQPLLPDSAAALPGLFPELRRQLQGKGCRFADCRHLGDPGCRADRVWERQALYARCLADVEAREQTIARAGSRRGGSLRQGGQADELLDPGLRRLSRRRQRQGLQGELQEAQPDELSPDPADSGPGPR